MSETRPPRHVLHHGDTLHILPTLPDCSVDAIVTDPPYELGFMGKTWDNAGIAYNPTMWAEALRVLKPGGHLVAFGGTRTYHRMTVAIEDAGFEVRDSLMWLYGSGFPKSHNIGKAIDKAAGATRDGGGREWSGGARSGGVVGTGEGTTTRTIYDTPATPEAAQWDGWGTALKPAYEPIVLARKPLVGTVAANVLQFGTGGLNVDGCRIPASGRPLIQSASESSTGVYGDGLNGSTAAGTTDVGRWPANVTLDPHAAHQVDTQSGVTTSGAGGGIRRTALGVMNDDGWQPKETVMPGHGDTGGASRFYYVAKANKRERPVVDGIAHPTVKPIALMRWLCRLTCPPGGLILDPFAGSGTTLEAALLEGFRVVGIEREADYLPLIQARIDRATTDNEEGGLW